MKLEAHLGNHTGVKAAYDELGMLMSELSEEGEAFGPSGRTQTLLSDLASAASA